ncbi:M1 family metallopeptidase [Parapedobacter sp. 10938]|uniref:M1 family metallopeptidase n=1 Tax=Parapedobacter flavus TaxID=3110225 RepID=UPI002DBFC04A|nr:M1 family metallopeptidase [Parapedobacter sp. 10938]MEC3879068.1 M1 family metallopeptidase [Parapedobacter sp. 10938]
MKLFLTISLLACVFTESHAQLLKARDLFGRADSLRGQLTPLRTCYDINYYHLDVRVDPDNRYIVGSNLFLFTATTDFDRLQFDLFDNLHLDSVKYRGQQLPFEREFNAVFIDFPKPINSGQLDSFTVYYAGHPVQAKRAPWDGGFDFKKDSNGKHWIATACQGLGASVWWPNKDHQSDEVDSMLISISVPNGLTNVSNGRYRGSEDLGDGYTRFNWFVSNPINNYGVAANIGDYVHFADTFQGEKGVLDLDYWVLRENEAKAKKHFDANVKPMLRAFEYWFGPYPFYADGFKLVETAHLGMEHQSAIAYGNKYQNGYLGHDGSGTGWGKKWDFIIVHEAGHEWFGNSITSKDLADMWIHESFTNYSESLYIEYHFGKRAGQEYIHGNRRSIQNLTPIIGNYHVNNEGSGDMYNKGGVLHNMVRTIIDDDEKWRQILRGINHKFYHSTVDYSDIVNYISEQSGKDFSQLFAQYVRYASIPTLEFTFAEDGSAFCRWIADVRDFDMPVRVRKRGGAYQFIQPTRQFTPVNIPGLTRDNLDVDTFNFYIGVLVE